MQVVSSFQNNIVQNNNWIWQKVEWKQTRFYRLSKHGSCYFYQMTCHPRCHTYYYYCSLYCLHSVYKAWLEAFTSTSTSPPLKKNLLHPILTQIEGALGNNHEPALVQSDHFETEHCSNLPFGF